MESVVIDCEKYTKHIDLGKMQFPIVAGHGTYGYHGSLTGLGCVCVCACVYAWAKACGNRNTCQCLRQSPIVKILR
jgi:hypothetical protein